MFPACSPPSSIHELLFALALLCNLFLLQPYFAHLTTSTPIAVTSQSYNTFIGRPLILEILDPAFLSLQNHQPYSRPTLDTLLSGRSSLACSRFAACHRIVYFFSSLLLGPIGLISRSIMRTVLMEGVCAL